MINHYENFGILSAILIDLDTLIADNQPVEKLTGTMGYIAAERLKKFKPGIGMVATYKDDYFPVLLTAALCEPEIGEKARKYLIELHTSLQGLQLREEDFKRLAKLQEKFEHKLKKLLKENTFYNPIIRAVYAGLTQPNITLLDVLVQLWDDPVLKGYVRNDFCDSKKHSPFATYTHLPKIDKGLFDLFEEIKKIETDYLGRLPFGYEAKFHFNLGHQLSKILVSFQFRRRPVENYLPTKVEEDFSFAKLNPGTLLQQASELTTNSQELTELYLLFEYIEALCQLEKLVSIEDFDEIEKIFYMSICRGFKLDCYQLLLNMRSEKYNHLSCRQILLEGISATYALFLESQLTYNVESPLSNNSNLNKVQNQRDSFFYSPQEKVMLPPPSLEEQKKPTHLLPVTRQ